MTVPGVPIIYYGDEMGMVGAGDPDCRRMMRFEGLNALETRTKNIAAQLATLRRTHIALIYGEFVPIAVTADTWVFARHYLGKTAIVVFNKSDKPAQISAPIPAYLQSKQLKPQFGNAATVTTTLNVTLAPYSFEILVD